MIRFAMLVPLVTLALILSPFASQQPSAPAPSAMASHSPGVLQRDRAGALMPTTVFFRGQTSSTQARNSAGIEFAGGKLVLTALVDTSGYSSAVQETYQGYLLTEVALDFGGHQLAPGAYGYGFTADHKAIVMDLGGNEIFETATSSDEKLARPTPLQVIAAPDGTYRLFLGRNYVTLRAAPSRR